jgi:peptidoglycan/xylan/chitin deacetylase (PgdA/CDA1 family)
MFYFAKTPWLLKKMYPYRIWDIPGIQKKVYLSFDDGPHPTITPFVLEELNRYNAKASFFCIGKNVLAHPEIFEMIVRKGHAVGNHTHNHLNGWKTPDDLYLDNILLAQQHISSNLFRPPYGRITKGQCLLLKKKIPTIKIIMWDVLSADFDIGINARKCTSNVLKHTKPGSIVVYHDSEKAFPRLQKSLPEVLKNLSERGYIFEAIPENLPEN